MGTTTDHGRIAGFLVPIGLCALIIAGSVLPLGLDAAGAMVAPHLLVCVIYFWGVRAPRALPAIAIFGFGLLIDLFSAGPLGFWPLVYLVAHGLTLLVGRYVRTRGFIALMAGFCPVAAAAGLAAWGVGCLYFGAWIDTGVAVTAFAAVCAAFPPLAIVFARLGSLRVRAGEGA